MVEFSGMFQIVQAEISGLFLDSFGLSSGLVLIPRLMSLGFVVCLDIIVTR